MWDPNDSPNQRREDPVVCFYEKNTTLDADDDMDKRVRLGSSSNDNSVSSVVVLEASDEDDRKRKSSSCKIFGFSVNGDREEDLGEAVVTPQFLPAENDGTPLPLPHWAGVKFCQSEPAAAGKSAADVAQPIKKSRRGPSSRSSQYRGVSFYRRTGRWESHIWDSGKQVYLGGFDTAHAAARAFDRAAIKFRGVVADINFNLDDYEDDLTQMSNLTKEEFVHVLRRQSTGYPRGSSKFGEVTLHKCGRWEARTGQLSGKNCREQKAKTRRKEDERENMVLKVVKDTAIEYIVQGALDAVKSCLQIGVDLFLGAENHLVKIEDSLVAIHDFIVIAEQSPKKDPKLMKLLEKLKDAAYDAQDLLEEYVIEDRRRSEKAANSMPVRDTMTNKARKVFISLVTAAPAVINREQIAMKVKEISERLEVIKAEAHAFQMEEKVTNLQIEFKKTRETYSAVDESQVFGRDEETVEIVSLLLSPQPQVGGGVEDDENENVSVIPIVGMGGLGKTTLAKLVFNHEVVQVHFELKMWICVSYNFDIIRLGNEIIECATRHNPSLSKVGELQCLLGETLSGKKFLLVLDDVWNEEPEKWYSLRDLLLCGGRGSRIVVTTRSSKVASIMSNIQPQILNPLSEDGCWSLFCQRAFGNPRADPNLAPIGREIVKKCGGIPLAVTTLGGLLCFERSQRKWEFVRDSEMWNLDDENEHGILPALRLSYNHLKPHLKQCFAFCAIFPQDYKIEKELVIKLWMAHGFIPTKSGMELEDIGNDIFDELVMRSFFQDVKVYAKMKKQIQPGMLLYISDGTTFQMHDLMHDLAHSVMENEYRVVHNGKSKDISSRIRHVSSNGLGILAASLPKAQMLRTYVMLEEVAFQFPCDVGLLKCLRALDFMRQDKQEVEKRLLTSLGNLQHLRYLNFSFTLIEMLPESLTSLCYLQTLLLRGCEMLCELPKKMCKLTNLRCLDITDCDKLTHMPPMMGKLSCLQELSNFIVGRANEIACSGIRELQGLNLGGRLKIQLLKNITDAIDVPRDTLINKPNLTSLDLRWDNSTDVKFGNLEEDRELEVLEKQVLQGLQPHRSLKKLGIFHYGGLNFPSWMMDTTLTALVKIKLSECWRCNHLPPLGELPFLKVLKIIRLNNVECIGNEFYGNEVSGGFPSLEELEIVNMQELKTWSGLEWKGERAFPSLVRLEFCIVLC